MIQLEDITKTYQMGELELQVLKGISLKVTRGEFIAIMGASGSGKSTLMNIIGCLDRSTTGDYFLDDLNIQEYSDEELAEIRNQKIGFVFQSFNLLPRLSAIENVELPMLYSQVPTKERSRRAVEALTRLGLGDRTHHKPKELSGGQQQRVSIARALVNQPSIVLADEPTGALDSKTSLEIMGLFQELHSQGITLVVITHDEEVAEYARRVVILRDGEVIEDLVKSDA